MKLKLIDEDEQLSKRGRAMGYSFRPLGTGGGVKEDYMQTTVTLTNDQIKALPTAPVKVVDAPGSGKALLLIRAAIVSDFRGGAYVLPVGTTKTIFAIRAANSPGTSGYGQSISTADVGWVMTDNSSQYWNTLEAGPLETDAVNFVVQTNNWGADVPDNRALWIYAVNTPSSTNFTGGNASNTMKVTVIYNVIDL